MGDLMSKLKQLMPERPQPKEGAMIHFDPQPIRRSAEAFAHAIDYNLPANQEELLALLWVFGELLDGHMEQHVKYLTQVADEAIACKPFPVMITPK